MLGHHRGDLRENVISNAHKGCGPLDLSGMTSVSRNDGVSLFRPLLSLEKTHIYDYSHKFGVPYFKDTTPHWSTRGKLRNRLLPLLEEIYGEGSMDNISSLAEESDAARALVQETVTSPFMQQIKRHPMGITFETSQWKDCGLFFWKFVLRQAVHSSGLGMFSDKSVDSFLDRVSAKNVREGWLQCRKDYAVFLRKDGRVLCFTRGASLLAMGKKQINTTKRLNFSATGDM
jgi:tRNA(Ile)-lysidine synthase TilS/MesJ